METCGRCKSSVELVEPHPILSFDSHVVCIGCFPDAGAAGAVAPCEVLCCPVLLSLLTVCECDGRLKSVFGVDVLSVGEVLFEVKLGASGVLVLC